MCLVLHMEGQRSAEKCSFCRKPFFSQRKAIRIPLFNALTNVLNLIRVLMAEIILNFKELQLRKTSSQSQNLREGTNFMWMIRLTETDGATKTANSKKRQDLEPRAPAVRWFHISPPHIYSAHFMTYRHIVFPHIPRKFSFLMNGWGCVWAAGFFVRLLVPLPHPSRGPEWESMKRFTCCRVADYITC